MIEKEDITQLVDDLAETPGVQRVVLARLGKDRRVTISVWPRGFKSKTPIMRDTRHLLFIEGEWESDNICALMGDFLNDLRAKAGLRPIRCQAFPQNEKMLPGQKRIEEFCIG